MRNSVNDDKVKAKLAADDLATITAAVDDALKWLEDHGDAEAEEFAEKQKATEAKISPLMAKIYGSAGGAPGGGEAPRDYDEPAAGPRVEEVD